MGSVFQSAICSMSAGIWPSGTRRAPGMAAISNSSGSRTSSKRGGSGSFRKAASSVAEIEFISFVAGGEVAFAIDGGGATHAGGGDRLTINVIGTIARNEHAFDVGLRAFHGNNVTVLVHVDDVAEEL